jgi:hypothetical protein
VPELLVNIIGERHLRIGLFEGVFSARLRTIGGCIEKVTDSAENHDSCSTTKTRVKRRESEVKTSSLVHPKEIDSAALGSTELM